MTPYVLQTPTKFEVHSAFQLEVTAKFQDQNYATSWPSATNFTPLEPTKILQNSKTHEYNNYTFLQVIMNAI